MASRGITPYQAQQIRAKKGLENTRLMKVRLSKGISQRNLAEISGVSERAIKGYEQQTRPIENAKLHTLYKLCIALDCKIGDILENEEMLKEWNKVK